MLFDRLADLLERERRIVGRADAYQNVHAIIVVANDIHLCGAYRLAQVPEAEIAQDAGDRDVIFAELIRIDGQSVRSDRFFVQPCPLVGSRVVVPDDLESAGANERGIAHENLITDRMVRVRRIRVVVTARRRSESRQRHALHSADCHQIVSQRSVARHQIAGNVGLNERFGPVAHIEAEHEPDLADHHERAADQRDRDEILEHDQNLAVNHFGFLPERSFHHFDRPVA